MREQVLLTGLGLYGAVLALVVLMVVWLLLRHGCSYDWARMLPLTSPRTLFFVFIIPFLLCRLGWFSVGLLSTDRFSDYVLNRIAFCLFFSAFTLTIIFWADMLHALRTTPSARQKGTILNIGFYRSWKPRAALIVINTIVYVTQLASILTFTFVARGEREGSSLYNANILAVVAFFGIICVAFLIYGVGLLLVTRRAMNTSLKLKFYIQTAMITMVLVLCFSMRFAVFLYRPVTGDFINIWLFAALAYFVPELLPVFIMSLALIFSLWRQMEINYQVKLNLHDYAPFQCIPQSQERLGLVVRDGHADYDA